MLAGATTDGRFLPGFLDVGSFKEYLAGWVGSVVVEEAVRRRSCRRRTVETRLSEQRVPADSGEPDSTEVIIPSWPSLFPDCLQDGDGYRISGENLPTTLRELARLFWWYQTRAVPLKFAR